MCAAFHIQTIPQGSQIFNEVKFPFMELFQPVNKEETNELEYQHFIAPNELIGLGDDHQQLLTSQKERQSGLMYPLDGHRDL